MPNRIHVQIDLEAMQGRVMLQKGTDHRVFSVPIACAEWMSLVAAIQRVLLRQRSIERKVEDQE